tara:strand:- start:170 stop:307 length:138 start_codon:yes stop_codon:yes gene_type:complete
MSEQPFDEQKPSLYVNYISILCGGFAIGVKILASEETNKAITNRK